MEDLTKGIGTGRVEGKEDFKVPTSKKLWP